MTTPPAFSDAAQPFGQDEVPVLEESDVVHEWAGDIYESGDESDPAQAFAQFAGQEGETAWLDKTDDGTLTGWVRDADGTVFRYSDADAWHIDVDQAGMTRSDAGDLGAEPVDDEAPVEDAIEGEGEVLEAEGVIDPFAPPADELSDEPALDEGEELPVDEEGSELAEDLEEDEDPAPFEGKSWLGLDGVRMRAVLI